MHSQESTLAYYQFSLLKHKYINTVLGQNSCLVVLRYYQILELWSGAEELSSNFSFQCFLLLYSFLVTVFPVTF